MGSSRERAGRHGERLGARTGNLPIIAVESIAATVAGRLTAAGVVLPFICVASGGPLLAASLIYPAYTVSRLIGTAATPALVMLHRTSKILLMVAGAVTAVVSIANAAGSTLLGDQMAVGFVVTGAVLGFLSGVSTVCFLDVVALALHPNEQTRLWILRSGWAAAAVVLLTGIDLLIFGNRNGEPAHVRLLWIGAAAMTFAAVCAVFIRVERTPGRPVPNSGSAHPPPAPQSDQRVSWRAAVAAARRTTWFGRYLVVQLLFVTMTLGSAFYSAHGASLHGSEAGSLHIIVSCTSVGLIIFALVWIPLRRRMTLRGMYRFAALSSLTGVALCILADHWSDRSSVVWLYGIILALSAVSALAIASSKRIWLLGRASGARLALISMSQIAIGTASALLAVAIGVLGHLHGVIWPVYCLAVINAVALPAVWWVPPTPLVKAEPAHPAQAQGAISG